MNSCVAAIDAGTGGVRCVIYEADGRNVSQDYREIKTDYACGRAEQDPHAFIESAFDAVHGAVSKANIDPSAIAGVGFCGTQTTFVPVDRDGNFLTDLILWQDMRGMEMFPMIRQLLSEHGMTERELYKRTLRPVDTLLAGAKLLWLRERQPDVYDRIHKVINPQSVLLRAFGAEGYTVDPSDTGWWLSHDSVTMMPDPQLSGIFGFDPGIFPDLLGPCDRAGVLSSAAATRTGLRAGTPLFQGAVDQCCAALGAGNCGEADLATMCLGTAGVITTCSDAPVPDPQSRYYVIHYPTGGFAGELAVPVAASAFRWVRDMLYPSEAFSHEDIYRMMDAEAATASIGADELLFLPHLSGSIYPQMDTSVRGGYIGASLSTSRADMVRAALEGIAFGMRHILESGKINCRTLRLIGGASRSDLWNRIQADIYNCPVETVADSEASALGAAMIAAAGAGLYPTLRDAVKGMFRVRKRYEPDPENAARYEHVYRAWLNCAEDLGARTFPSLEGLRRQNRR